MIDQSMVGFRNAVKCFFPAATLLAAACLLQAEPGPLPETAESKAIAELSAAYAKQGGYIATYRSEGEGKSLDCTVAADFATGLGVTHLTAVKDGRKREARLWSTANDRMFMSTGDNLYVFKGLNEELKSNGDLRKVFTSGLDASESGMIQFTPGMLLLKEEVSPTLAIRTKIQPPWNGEVKEAAIHSSDDTTVTFLTKEYGLLTISRENGMLIRQSLTGEKAEARVLELKSLQPKPGKEAVLKLSADWSTADAEEKNAVAWMAPFRLLLFQLIIDSAEEGQVDKGKLDELLEEQYETLRNFAKACLNEKEGAFTSKLDWPRLLGAVKSDAKISWKAEAADAADEKAFREYLLKAEVRLSIRNQLIEGFLKQDKVPEGVMDDIFGRGGWASLKVGNDRGVAAKKSLVNALARAYLEALIDAKMTREWDELDGVD